jgi:hypothetical protein
MKAKVQILLIVALLCVCSSLIVAATITSNGTGGGLWSATTTWNGGVVPTTTDDVTIVSGDSVHISSANVTCHSITISSGAKVKGTMNLEGGTGGVSGGGTFTIESNATFYQDRNSGTKWPQLFATYSIHSNSNYVVNTLGTPPSSICNAPPAEYGNLIINRSGAVLIAAATITFVDIKGSLTVDASGGGFKLSNNKSSVGSSSAIHVGGNVYVKNGYLSAIDNVSATTNVNVDGNVIVGDASTASGVAALTCVSAADAAVQRTGVFNINGNLSIINGAKVECGTSTASTGTTEVGIINLKGNLSTDATASTATNTKGSFAINFVGTGTQTVTLGNRFRFASTAMWMTLNDTVAATSNVVFNGGHMWSSEPSGAPTNGNGQWVVNGSLTLGANDTIGGVQAFNLNSGATLKTANANGLASNGSIQVSGTVNLGNAANYEYNGSVAQVTGMLLPRSGGVNNLTINNSAGVTLTRPTTVNGVLSLAAGLLDNSVNQVYLCGTLSTGAGSISRATGPCGGDSGVKDISIASGAPREFRLYGNYPNPFNPTTEIRFTVPKNGYATLKIFNVLGQEVETLFAGTAQAGQYITVSFDGTNMTSGVYFARLEHNGTNMVQRMVLAK